MKMKRIYLLIIAILLCHNLTYGQSIDSLSANNQAVEYAFLVSSGAFKHRLNIYYESNKLVEDFLEKYPSENIKGSLDQTWEIMAAFQHLNRQGYHLITSHAFVFSATANSSTTYVFARPKTQTKSK
jgi:hypothetical protein